MEIGNFEIDFPNVEIEDFEVDFNIELEIEDFEIDFNFNENKEQE